MKQLILDVLDFWKYKVENNKCTPEEMKNISDVISDNLDIMATVNDISKIYGKSPNNVRVVMSHNQFQKSNPPKIQKFYNFLKFREIIPQSWRKDKK